MELIIGWIMTIIASVIMEISSELRIFKDVADNGYKLDVKRISELANQVDPNASKVTLMSFLVPGVNIFGVFKRGIIYNNVRHMILDQLSVLDSLIPMTKEEEEEYKKNPSALNAIYINARQQTQSASQSISYLENDEINTIWFNEENENYIVIKAEGPISKLSIIEQRAKLIEKMDDFKAYSNIKDFFEYCNDKKDKKDICINLDQVIENNKNIKPLTKEEYIELMKSVRRDLEDYKADVKDSEETKGFQKTKKRK